MQRSDSSNATNTSTSYGAQSQAPYRFTDWAAL